MGSFDYDKIYMTEDDETDETLALVAMLEGKSVTELCEMIDRTRTASCGFARAARIFSIAYITAFMKQDVSQQEKPYSVALSLQQAMLAVSNDTGATE